VYLPGADSRRNRGLVRVASGCRDLQIVLPAARNWSAALDERTRRRRNGHARLACRSRSKHRPHLSDECRVSMRCLNLPMTDNSFITKRICEGTRAQTH